MKNSKTKWWIGLGILLFIIINLVITNLTKEEESPTNENVLIEGNISTH